jgi:hypothetical protein
MTKPEFSEEDFAFARNVFLNKHHKPLALYLSWRWFVQLLQTCSAPGACHLSTITEVSTGKIVALFVEFRQSGFHHFITAMVDHKASSNYGIYVAKYRQLLASCIR